jgi:tRNA (adenine57-N1/adenine58-N1)-methyltransferase
MYSVVRDVCEEGFDLIDAADAVFLDLPHPWKVVPHAKIALKVSNLTS